MLQPQKRYGETNLKKNSSPHLGQRSASMLPSHTYKGYPILKMVCNNVTVWRQQVCLLKRLQSFLLSRFWCTFHHIMKLCPKNLQFHNNFIDNDKSAIFKKSDLTPKIHLIKSHPHLDLIIGKKIIISKF